KGGRVVVGRDSRPSGEMLKQAVLAGLVSVGCDVVDIGIVPTPTVEIAVEKLNASGGICLTASHNPAEWNALKFFSSRGEFITGTQFKRLSRIYESRSFSYRLWDKIGKISTQPGWIDRHIRMVLSQSVVARAAIRRRKFTVVVDAVNGAGSVALPALLEKLGVKVITINCRGDGNFVHPPEPRPENLKQLCRAVKRHRADLGMACDPDADRLALVDENGQPVSEEYTLTIAVLEVLSRRRGATVINLSTSRTTADIARSLASRVYYAPVGEANVVAMMHARKAIIGGEGNGGVILPAFHAGRDSLIAAALVLSALARRKRTLSGLVGTFPAYYTIKKKAPLPVRFTSRLQQFEKTAGRMLGDVKVDRRDGLRFDFADGWAQIRKSNTEPIFRLIVETRDRKMTERLTRQIMARFRK
ncbi:MAG: phosphoglucosamine mutase, partial [Candidatus Zixiibacteriota bacterium]